MGAWYGTQQQQQGLELGQRVLAALDTYPAALLAGPLGVEFVALLDDIGKRQLLLHRHDAARESYERALALNQDLAAFDEQTRRHLSSSIYHQLGVVAQAQRRWAEAEGHYRQALALKVEFGDRYAQATTRHQLGRVAEEQRRWAEAREAYVQCLTIMLEADDEHNLGITLRSLARLWRAGEDATLPGAVAAVIGRTAGEVEERLRKALPEGTE